MNTMIITTANAMKQFGKRIGSLLRGGECLELIGDVGTGKTTFVTGLAAGLEVSEDVQSPSFTLSREYEARDGLRLVHYDFYRLHEAGVLGYELAESLADLSAVSVIEWGETIGAVLPDDRIVIVLSYSPHDETREVTVVIPKNREYLKDVL